MSDWFSAVSIVPCPHQWRPTANGQLCCLWCGAVEVPQYREVQTDRTTPTQEPTDHE